MNYSLILRKHWKKGDTLMASSHFRKQYDVYRNVCRNAGLCVCFVLFLLSAAHGGGNNPSAWILEVRGPADIIHDGVHAPGPVRPGIALFTGDSVITDKDSLVRIIYQKRGIYTVRGDETYKILGDMPGPESMGKGMGKIWELLVSKFNGKLRVSEDPVPMVSRGSGQPLRNEAGGMAPAIPVYPRNSRINKSDIKFAWLGETDTRYVLTLYLSDELHTMKELVWRKEIKATSVAYNNSACALKRGSYYLWRVTSPGGRTSDTVWFSIVSEEEEREIDRGLAEIEASTVDQGALITHMLRAVLFEKKELYHSAIQEYDDVLAISDNEAYKKMRGSILFRMKYKEIKENGL
jgi:hypothetical protein